MYLHLLLVAALSSVVASINVIEVLFVVEPQVIRNYVAIGYDKRTAEKTFKGDLDFILSEVNNHLASMKKNRVNIELRVKKTIMMNKELYKSGDFVQEGKIKTKVSLDVLGKWLEATGNEGHDLAMVLTGYNIVDQNDMPMGVATYAAICSTGALAAVEFFGGLGEAIVMAHEIGHSLGSHHDGEKNLCPPSLGNIMSTNLKPKGKGRWEFSKCSAKSVKETLKKLKKVGKNCLKETSVRPAPAFKLSSQANRDILDPMKLCKRKTNWKDSYLCLDFYRYPGGILKGDAICQCIYCAIEGSTMCSATVPTEGMVCDVGKRCKKGQCVSPPSSFPVTEKVKKDCLFGDMKGGNIWGQYSGCEEAILAIGSNNLCNSNAKGMCCETCSKTK